MLKLDASYFWGCTFFSRLWRLISRFYVPALLLAIAFLTVIPSSKKRYSQRLFAVLLKLSVVFYPLVGLLIGGVLCGLVFILEFMGQPVQAAMILCAWVLITGGLHLDGLADSVDAIYAGHKFLNTQRLQKMQAVFKDPHIGTIAVVSLILILLLQYQLIVTLLGFANKHTVMYVLLAAPFLARLGAVIYIQTTPYNSVNGTLSQIYTRPHLPYTRCIFLYLSVIIGLAALINGHILSAVIFMLLTLSCVVFFWRRFWLKSIGGYNGDCAGALIVLLECGILLIAHAICTFYVSGF